MSSKRKNTPTKLPKDDVVTERPIYNSLPQDFNHYDLDRDLDYQPQLHIVDSHGYSNGLDTHDSDSSYERDRPTNKKQRILQSVRHSSDSESDQEYTNSLTNSNSTKPALGLHRKSMESVLRRLNSSSSHGMDSEMDKEYIDKCLLTSQGSQDKQLLLGIQQLLGNTDSTQDKEKRLGDMIAQLQTLRENIKKEKTVSSSRNVILGDNIF